MYARYYQQYYDYIKGLNPDGSFIPLAVPEPSQVALLLVVDVGGNVCAKTKT
jgi:hypothetical protein